MGGYVPHHGSPPQTDAGTVIVTHLDVFDDPVGAERTVIERLGLDGSVPRWHGIPLHDQALDRDISGVAGEGV